MMQQVVKRITMESGHEVTALQLEMAAYALAKSGGISPAAKTEEPLAAQEDREVSAKKTAPKRKKVSNEGQDPIELTFAAKRRSRGLRSPSRDDV